MNHVTRCNKIVTCYDMKQRPCLRPQGHSFRCNPWSASFLAADNSKRKPARKIVAPKRFELAS
jgi:hypothetical protein